MGAQTLFTQLKDRLGGFQFLIIVVMLLLLGYHSYSTMWIPPTNKINTTDAYNRTVEVTGIYSYIYKDYIPKQNSFEFVNSQIPKGSFEFGSAVFLMFALIVLSMLNVYKKEIRKEPLPYHKILEKAKTHLSLMKSEGIIREYTIPQGALDREKQIDDGDKIPESWFIPAEVVSSKGEDEYRLLAFYPFTGELKEDLKNKKEFKGEDKCPDCGKYAHQKVITPAGYKIWEEQFSSKK